MLNSGEIVNPLISSFQDQTRTFAQVGCPNRAECKTLADIKVGAALLLREGSSGLSTLLMAVNLWELCPASQACE
jgi:hypothetical protein